MMPGVVHWSQSLPRPVVTRFAPSPTGWLHLGHVANAVWTWGVARATGGRVLLRMEDHDRGRCRPGYERQILADLEWLGLAAEPESVRSLGGGTSRFRQSDSGAAYEAALQLLGSAGLVYGCTCSRSSLARELGDGLAEGQELRYPGICRGKGLAPGPGLSCRIRLPEGEESFQDFRLGEQRQEPQRQCGDLLARDRNGNWSYQFAVTVDDLRQDVSLVIRGEDLLSSTGRQVALARLLGRSDPPRFLHHPVIRNEAGEKLGKRDGALGLKAMRAAGLTPAEVLAKAAELTGWRDL